MKHAVVAQGCSPATAEGDVPSSRPLTLPSELDHTGAGPAPDGQGFTAAHAWLASVVPSQSRGSSGPQS